MKILLLILTGTMLYTQAAEDSNIALNIVDSSTDQKTQEIIVRAVLTNKGKREVRLSNWIETGWGYNLDLALVPKGVSSASPAAPITCSGTSRGIVRMTSMVLSPGGSINLTGVFNPKRGKGVYTLSVSLRGVPSCSSKGREIQLMESKGKTK